MSGAPPRIQRLARSGWQVGERGIIASARELERRRPGERYGVRRRSPIDPQARTLAAERIAILPAALDELELELALERAPSPDDRRG